MESKSHKYLGTFKSFVLRASNSSVTVLVLIDEGEEEARGSCVRRPGPAEEQCCSEGGREGGVALALQ